MIELRDALVPVCDLHARLGVAAVEGGADQRIILIGDEERPAGMVVDRIGGLVPVPETGLQPLPVGDDPLLAGLAASEGRLVIVLDLDVLLAEVAGPGAPTPATGTKRRPASRAPKKRKPAPPIS